MDRSGAASRGIARSIQTTSASPERRRSCPGLVRGLAAALAGDRRGFLTGPRPWLLRSAAAARFPYLRARLSCRRDAVCILRLPEDSGPGRRKPSFFFFMSSYGRALRASTRCLVYTCVAGAGRPVGGASRTSYLVYWWRRRADQVGAQRTTPRQRRAAQCRALRVLGAVRTSPAPRAFGGGAPSAAAVVAPRMGGTSHRWRGARRRKEPPARRSPDT